MSGQKLRANPKSILPMEARVDEFIISDVRCFSDVRASIRPLTFLVGENSTGKSTFLGGFRILHKMFMPRFFSQPGGLPTFNDDPFLMGAFRDIVRHSRMRNSHFQLGGKIVYPSRSGNVGEYDVIYSFCEKGSEPAIFKMAFIFSNKEKMELIVKKKGKSSVDMELVGPGFAFKFPPYARVRGFFPAELLWWLSYSQSGKKDEERKRMRDFFKRHFGLVQMAAVANRVIPSAPDEFAMAPFRAKPKRTYDPVGDEFKPEGDHIPMFLAQLSRTSKGEWEWLRDNLAAFGKSSGMFSEFAVKKLGVHVSDPFQLQVKVSGAMSNILDVGYGVSQVYPLLVQILIASRKKNPCCFLLQQPEVHLHPQAQAALGSFFVNSAVNGRHTFLVETHSDFIVDRVCTHVAKGDIAPDDVSLLYFEKQKSGGVVKIHRIELNRNGEPVSVPQGYRDFFQHETERVLGLRKD